VLVATSEVTVGSAAMRSSLLFERAIRGTLIERTNLVFDTKYAAAASGKPEPVGHLFMQLTGTFEKDVGAKVSAPIAVMLADDEWERPGKDSRTFRTEGEQVNVVQLRFARDMVKVPIGLEHGALALSPASWKAAAALLAAGPSGDVGALTRALDTLASDGIIAATLPGTVIGDEPERFRRLWDALRPLFKEHGATASLKQLANSLGMSMRQVGRDAKELSTAFGIGGGYRDALLVLRLRQAVVLLSAPDATVADIARIVGYGSPIAMARAFRDADLPAPSVIQAGLRGGQLPSPQ
jgi:AraC-like DNA-binding protein